MTWSRKTTRWQWQPSSLTRISDRHGNARSGRDAAGEAWLRWDLVGTWGRHPLLSRRPEPLEPGGGRAMRGALPPRQGYNCLSGCRRRGPGLCVTMTMVNRFTGFQRSGYVQFEPRKAQSPSSSRTHVPIHGSVFTSQKTRGLGKPLKHLVLVTGHFPCSDLY